jgi:sulfoxide reductase heme-binding subunit YedZ
MMSGRSRGLTAGLFLLCCVPFTVLLAGAVMNTLGANPVEALIRELGEWALRLLLLTLAATPLQRWLKWGLLLRYRRMLGLFAFFYALLHLLAFIWFEHFFAWSELLTDIIKRPFIAFGMVAWLMLLPLAVTSSRRAVRRLGYGRWLALHRLVYLAAALAVGHFFMLVKADLREPAVYAGILSVLLLARLVRQPDAARGAGVKSAR